MRTLDIVLYVAALVCFVIATVKPTRINLIALGLAFVVLVPLIVLVRAG